MNLRLALSAFERAGVEVVGRLITPAGEVEARLLADGGAYFGPLEDPLPQYLLFDRSRTAYVADSRGRQLLPLPDELVEAGPHLILLYDPRVYLVAEDKGILQEASRREYGVESVIGKYRLYDMATTVFGLRTEIGEFLERSLGSHYQTEVRLVGDAVRLTLSNKASSIEGVRAEYVIPRLT